MKMDINNILYAIFEVGKMLLIILGAGAVIVLLYFVIPSFIENAIYKHKLRKMTPEERDFELLPYRCKGCEVVGMCREPKNHWKCIEGCMIATDNAKEHKNG